MKFKGIDPMCSAFMCEHENTIGLQARARSLAWCKRCGALLADAKDDRIMPIAKQIQTDVNGVSIEVDGRIAICPSRDGYATNDEELDA